MVTEVEICQLTYISKTDSLFGKWFGAVKFGFDDYRYVNSDGSIHMRMGSSQGTYFDSKEQLIKTLGEHSHFVLIDKSNRGNSND